MEVSALLLGQVSVIVVDSNGNFQCLGCTEAVECSESTGEIGAAKTDPNRYSITLSDTSGLYAPFMTAAAIEEFLDERTSN